MCLRTVDDCKHVTFRFQSCLLCNINTHTLNPLRLPRNRRIVFRPGGERCHRGNQRPPNDPFLRWGCFVSRPPSASWLPARLCSWDMTEGGRRGQTSRWRTEKAHFVSEGRSRDPETVAGYWGCSKALIWLMDGVIKRRRIKKKMGEGGSEMR